MNAPHFEGKSCQRGHDGTRYASGRRCVECVKAENAAFYKANSERVKTTNAAWNKANPETVKANQAAYRRANPEKARARSAAWQKANPEKMRAHRAAWKRANPAANAAMMARRRARKIAAPGRGVTAAQWRHCLAESLGLCAYCGERRPLTPDHIEPLSRGGAHDIENIAAVCGACNFSKCDTPLMVWLARRSCYSRNSISP